jgi:ribonuclease BN (tRNA processing enzyme)
MRLTVLGCHGSYPGRGGACSGYLVRGGGTTIWLDAGSGSLANLQRHVGLADVDAVVLTHEHPDHWTDVEGYAVACQYGLERTGVPVYGPAGVRAAVGERAPTFSWRTVEDGASVDIGGLRCTFSRTDHGPETLAVRVDGDGRSLGYSADSGPGWSLEALGPGLDLALCEATFLRDREGTVLHMSGRQAGDTARAARAARLMITHIWPTIPPALVADEASDAFGRRVEVATLNASTEL